MEENFKMLLLARYCAQFLQADEDTATIRKTSEEIKNDLRPAADDLSINEISRFMVDMGYTLGFEDATPVWLMRENPSRELPE